MLTREQRVILTKIINAGVSKAGCVLSELIGCRVRMQVPIVGVTDFADLSGNPERYATCVCLPAVPRHDGRIRAAASVT
jgi:chemotaxis protein CheY-P-specific phosphatase CheC